MSGFNPLQAVFKTTETGRTVFRPVGYLSPVSIVLKSDQDVAAAKRIYWGCGALSAPLLLAYFHLAEPSFLIITAVLLLGLIGIHILIYLGVSLFLPDHEIYNAARHGVLNDPL